LPNDAPPWRSTAAAAAGAQQYPAPALYVVATPIGNLADVSLRALHVLALADVVACEDSRVTGLLLRHFGIDKPLLPLHEHNERAAAGALIERLRAGARVAYASDAGTPGVSDPGAALVETVVAAGHRVVPVPGASSVIAALSVAGDATGEGFRVCGFAPSKGQARQHAWDAAAADRGTQVWLEAPHRMAALAQEWAARMPDRKITVCRELTKQFESIATMQIADMPAWLAADARRQRGEFALVLHALPRAGTGDGGGGDTAADAELQRVLDVLLAELPLKQAVALAARIARAPRNVAYALALQRRAETRGGD
jgi:16S rRNA (cytidine1402-2'-O)-methyltransferase